jgi:hypothetical protein
MYVCKGTPENFDASSVSAGKTGFEKKCTRLDGVSLGRETGCMFSLLGTKTNASNLSENI